MIEGTTALIQFNNLFLSVTMKKQNALLAERFMSRFITSRFCWGYKSQAEYQLKPGYAQMSILVFAACGISFLQVIISIFVVTGVFLAWI